MNMNISASNSGSRTGQVRAGLAGRPDADSATQTDEHRLLRSFKLKSELPGTRS